jgi:hypothetical protein
VDVQGTPRVRGLPVVAFAVGGLVLGHALAYLLAIPDSAHRDAVLRTTGHAYLPALGEAALILLLTGTIAILVRAISSRRPDAPERYRSLAGLLGTVQVAAFVGQEVIERLVSRAPLVELVHDHVLAFGVAFQILLALAGAAVLRWLTRASTRLVDVVMRAPATPRPALVGLAPTPADPPHGSALSLGPSVRAPPSA